MDEQLQQLISRLGQAQNILVAVSKDPSVDQLSAALGLTLVLNKIGKHGTAVFSGQVPSTLEFLKPEKTIEKNTDSLRDFIIALDKSKADKLRYKVEDDVVRIFITPYRVSISDKDLQFSQGDFNVDVVICLGVSEQNDLDTAITAHGRILHDATVASISTVGQGSLGSINWVEPTASSLSEMIVGLSDGLDKMAMDEQIATALLTGIVANTERFSNDKTTPKTMSASAELMAAGANQQLIASELETPPEAPAPQPEVPAKVSKDEPDQQTPAEQPAKTEPGTLEIDHQAEVDEPTETPDEPEQLAPQVHVDEDGQLTTVGETPIEQVSEPEAADTMEQTATAEAEQLQKPNKRRERITEKPRTNGDLTANTTPESLDAPTEELSLPSPLAPPLLTHDEPKLPDTLQPAPQNWQPPVPSVEATETLSEIEQSVDSPHLQVQSPAAEPVQADSIAADDTTTVPPSDEPVQSDDNSAATSSVDDARSAVEAALNGASAPERPLQPIAALNAQPFGPELQDNANAQVPAANPFNPPSLPAVDPAQSAVPNGGFSEPTPGNSPADETLDMPLPTSGFAAPGSNPLISPFNAGTPMINPSDSTTFPTKVGQASNGNNDQTPPPVPPPMLPPLQ